MVIANPRPFWIPKVEEKVEEAAQTSRADEAVTVAAITESPLCRLPGELLLFIMQCMDGVPLFCLRRTCRQFMRIFFGDISLAHYYASGGGAENMIQAHDSLRTGKLSKAWAVTCSFLSFLAVIRFARGACSTYPAPKRYRTTTKYLESNSSTTPHAQSNSTWPKRRVWSFDKKFLTSPPTSAL